MHEFYYSREALIAPFFLIFLPVLYARREANKMFAALGKFAWRRDHGKLVRPKYILHLDLSHAICIFRSFTKPTNV